MSNWYVAADGACLGPFTLEQLQDDLASGRHTPATLVWRDGFADWLPAGQVPELQPGARPQGPPPVTGKEAHEIDYTIFGHEMQFVEIELDPQESVIAEAGAMMYMHEQIVMQTVFGDGSRAGDAGSFLDKMIGAGKRLVTGEGLFTTLFTYTGAAKGRVAFAAPYPGKIIPLDLSRYHGRIICQKDAFLCAAKGVSVGIAFQKKIGVALFGGEGFFFANLRGPGHVWLQSLPFSRLAGRIWEAAPQTLGGAKGEGSVLGGLANIFER